MDLKEKPVRKSKKEYKQKFRIGLRSQENFIKESLRKEWEELKKSKKRDEMLNTAKAGMITVAKTLLTLAAVGGIITVASIAPNAVGATVKIWSRRGFFEKRTFQKASFYLKSRGFVRIVEKGEGCYEVKITDKGMMRMSENFWGNFKIKRSREWDGWWRIVVFDISDRHKNERDIFREKLKSLGFYKLQESVFIFPDPCEKELQFLIYILGISEYVRLIKAKQIVSDGDIKDHFGVQQ